MSLILLAALASPMVGADAASRTVDISGSAYLPSPLLAEAGDEVTWKNLDNVPHTVTCHAGSCPYSSPTLNRDATFKATLVGSGTQTYFCAVHPSMLGEIYVGTNSAASPDLAPVAGSLKGGRASLGGLAPNPLVGQLSVEVENLGGSASAAAKVEFRAKDPAGEYAAIGTADVPALAPGERAVVTLDWTSAPLVGTADVQVALDPENGVVEGKESNNVASATVQIGLL